MSDKLQGISIETPNKSHVQQLSEFMMKTFVETFGHTYPPEHLEAYLKGSYTPAIQLDEIQDPKKSTFICIEKNQIVGYAMLHYGAREVGINGPDPVVEIQRFYLDSAWHGSGLASLLMKHVLELNQVRAAKTIWLGVWENNFKAQAFYKKFGFDKVGEHDFIVGETRDLDFLFARHQ